MPDTGPPLPAHEVQVWLARPEHVPIPQLTERLGPFLSDDEHARCARFHFEHDRKHFIAAHGLLRQVLAQHLDCAPRDLQFSKGANGKPQLEAGFAAAPLSFNLSHTRGLVACAVTLTGKCGIDVERIRTMTDLDGVAETVYSPDELRYLARAGSDEAARLSAFFRLWTLKEAYFKATGSGMSAPLRQISIDPAALSLKDDSCPQLISSEWLLDSWMVAPDHALALACDSAAAIRRISYYELDLNDSSVAAVRTIQAGDH